MALPGDSGCRGVGLWMVVRSSVEGVLAELAEPRRAPAPPTDARSTHSFETAQKNVVSAPSRNIALGL